MANNIIRRVWNQGSMTPIEDLQGSAFTNENGGHTFQISGVDSNGEALALSGTVAASFLRPDQTTVGISGSVSGGVASVTLSEECYGIPGRFGLVVFLTSDGKKAAIYSCVGNVARSSTDAVAPGVVADVVDLINEIQAAVDTIPASYSALMADIAPTYSSSALYAVGYYAWYEGDLKRCIVPITVGETYTPAHWTSAVVGDDVCALKSALNALVPIKDSDETGVDLDISDPSGNVIARFADGHIKTKNFDSSNIESDSGVYVNDSTKTGVDLDVSDRNGNVVARFSEGGIQTKRFNSKDVLPPIETFSANKTFVRGETNTITVNQAFYKGDEIYFHLDDGYKYCDYGQYAVYYQGNTAITGSRRGSNGYFRHIITANCSSVGVTISGTEYANGKEITLYVYRKNGEVKPKVITVKPDGTGMFSTLKSAVESITDANHLTNPYIIEVYEGIYNTLDGYTEEEIQSADIGGGYDQDTMVGVKLTDGISLKGIGRADDIILYAELSTTDYSSGVRANISTLNIEGEGSIENVTIEGKHIRYCVHDDFVAPVNSHDRRILRNLKFKGDDLAYSPLFTTYGAGMNAPRDYLIENCDFGYDLGIHSNGGYLFGCTIEVNNCSGTRFRIGDSAIAESNATNRVIVNNCNFQVLQTTHASENFASHMVIEGAGNEQTMIKDTLATMYRLGMIDLIPSGFTTGKMLKRKNSGLEMEVTNNKAIAHGIVIGSDENFSYVQKCGYIASNYLGLTGLSVGDYITVDNTGSVVANGTASDAIGVVTTVDDGIGFIKLMI